MKGAHPHQTAEVSAPATGASIVALAGPLPTRTDTVRAQALRHQAVSLRALETMLRQICGGAA